MLIHPTVERLRALGLAAMADAFIEMQNAPDAAELSREDWLGLLVDREATSRENKRLARRLREAKLRQAAVVEDVNLRAPRGLDRALFQKLATCEWVRDHHHLVVVGPTGIGKSWLACALGHKACREGFSVLYKRAGRLFGDLTGRLWTYVRDDRPFGGPAPPAAVFYYSRDRTGEHPQRHLQTYAGIFQADAYGGYNKLYEEGRQPGLILEAACWVHARRSFFVLADLAASARRKAQGKTPAAISPTALEAVRRIDALFDIEREINGHSADQRRAVRQELSAPLVAELEAWMRQERARLSRHNDVAQAMDYMLKRWTAFTRFLDDGRICLSNNAAERSVRGIALGRRAWLFAGSDRGGERAAFMYSLIVTAKMNDIDPQAWLADVLRRIADHPASRLHELLPWHWGKPVDQAAAA